MSATIVVHGGAGLVEEARTRAVLAGARAAAEAGRALLAQGRSALDAVCAAVERLEADPEFNAGHGSALTRLGTVEVDAAVMASEGLRAGAVAAVPRLRHPVVLARRVLEAGEHVLLVGEGALAFAAEQGILPEPEGALATSRERARLERWRAGRMQAGGGTVGAVACDQAGRLAAATSTGGTTGKRPGRVGDSPIVGAGTYADEAGACSATGHGEAILRVLAARAAVDRMRAGASAPEAARATIAELSARTGAEAGLILVAPDGQVGLAHGSRHLVFAIARAEKDEIQSGLESP